MSRSARAHYTAFTLYYGARDFYLILTFTPQWRVWRPTVGPVTTHALLIITCRKTNGSIVKYLIIFQKALKVNNSDSVVCYRCNYLVYIYGFRFSHRRVMTSKFLWLAA